MSAVLHLPQHLSSSEETLIIVKLIYMEAGQRIYNPKGRYTWPYCTLGPCTETSPT